MLYMPAGSFKLSVRGKQNKRLKKKPYISNMRKKSIKSIVNKEIDRRAEVLKIEPQAWLQNRITNYLVDPVTQCIPLVPNIDQGAGQGGRDGNTVRTRKAKMHITMSADAFANSSGYIPPFYVDMYIYKCRKSNVQSAVPLNKFLQDGDSSKYYDTSIDPLQPTNMFSGQNKVNADEFVLKKHKRVLLWNQSFVARENGLAIQNMTNVSNARTFTIDVTKYLKKNITFQDAVNNTPQDNLYVSCVATPNDYITSYVQNQVFGQFQVMFEYEYDDL